MRPTTTMRPTGAAKALGALCFATTLAVLPNTAHSDDTNPTNGGTSAQAARVADVAPGHSRLNVLAGRRATVRGHTRPALAGRPVLLQRAGGHGWATIDRATTRAAGRFAFAFRPQRPGTPSSTCWPGNARP